MTYGIYGIEKHNDCKTCFLNLGETKMSSVELVTQKWLYKPLIRKHHWNTFDMMISAFSNSEWFRYQVSNL
jgi:hypothetical protein